MKVQTQNYQDGCMLDSLIHNVYRSIQCPNTTAKRFPVKRKETLESQCSYSTLRFSIYLFFYFFPCGFPFLLPLKSFKGRSLSHFVLTQNSLRQPDLDPPASVIQSVRKSLWGKTHRETKGQHTPLPSGLCGLPLYSMYYI